MSKIVKKEKKYFYFYGIIVLFLLYYVLTLLNKEGFTINTSGSSFIWIITLSSIGLLLFIVWAYTANIFNRGVRSVGENVKGRNYIGNTYQLMTSKLIDEESTNKKNMFLYKFFGMTSILVGIIIVISLFSTKTIKA